MSCHRSNIAQKETRNEPIKVASITIVSILDVSIISYLCLSINVEKLCPDYKLAFCSTALLMVSTIGLRKTFLLGK